MLIEHFYCVGVVVLNVGHSKQCSANVVACLYGFEPGGLNRILTYSVHILGASFGGRGVINIGFIKWLV